MNLRYSSRIRVAIALVSALGLVSKALSSDGPPAHYQATYLVSDVAGMAAATDSHLVNPWGLSRSATSPWWVADNGTGLSTLYNGTGTAASLVVTIPNAASATDASAPTGTVFNGVATDFLVAAGKPAHFLFATEEGTIAGWNGGTSAVVMVNNVGTAVYKGLTLAALNGANLLYAANFQSGEVDVFDRTFQPVALGASAFHDPDLPPDYAPFNVQRIGDSIYVTFAQKEPGSIDETHGPGKGFVDAFSPAGMLERRLRWGAWFNAPWGVALAPADFGAFSNLLLVGQFGSGRIAAFDPATGEFRGTMRRGHGQSLVIDGLWALAFGNGAGAGPTNTLYFTAGIDDEAHGLFGTITPIAKAHDHGDRDGDDDTGHTGAD
jgi:uncharacterized protein (TIGR03118 family)